MASYIQVFLRSSLANLDGMHVQNVSRAFALQLHANAVPSYLFYCRNYANLTPGHLSTRPTTASLIPSWPRSPKPIRQPQQKVYDEQPRRMNCWLSERCISSAGVCRSARCRNVWGSLWNTSSHGAFGSLQADSGLEVDSFSLLAGGHCAAGAAGTAEEGDRRGGRWCS